jgi:outer membrane biosynthesis protein TonB
MKSKFFIFLGIISAVIALTLVVTMISSSDEQRAYAQTVPKLSGLNVNAAKEELADESFSYRLMYTESTAAKGTVLKQIPAAGVQVKDGAVIRLYVAIPPRQKAPTTQPQLPQTPEAPSTQQQTQNTNPNNQQQPQQNTQKTKAQRDAERQAIIDRINADYEAELKKLQEEQAQLAQQAAENARIKALSDALSAATNERYAAFQALQQAQASVNDFAGRGMLQSGAGSQASAARDAAQIRYDNALLAEQAANAAYAAR